MSNLLLHVKSNKKRIHTSFLMALLVAFPVTLPAFEVKNSEYGFGLEVPDEFESFDVLAALRGPARQLVEKNLLYGFVSGGDTENPSYTHFLIEKSSMWMTVSPLPIDNRSVMENAWKGIDINLYRNGYGFQNGKPTRITLTAAIPLKSGPIQIKLSGPAENEKKLMSILNSTLASLQAEASLFADTHKSLYWIAPLGLLIFSVYRFRKGG